MKDSNNIKLNNIIDEIVNNKLYEIEQSGAVAILPGNNGPYYNEETNVRNMAHWCVTFSKYYEKTQEEKYLNVVRLLADAILASEHYNGQGVYKCRSEKASDEVNGVIGPAWIIEGLMWALHATGDERYYERAREMFLVVPFYDRLSIWNRMNTKGKKLSVDVTFNHQLWFAAAGAMINAYKEDEEISRRLDAFVKNIQHNVTIRKDGRIAHFTMNDQNGLLGYPGMIYRDIKNDILEFFNKPSFAYKEAGYHAFNLYGFAILKEYYKKDIPFINTKKFKKSLDYVCNTKYIDILCSADRSLDQTRIKSKLDVKFNLFAFAYNSPAFELPKIYDAFGLHNSSAGDVINTLCDKQIEYTYDESLQMFAKNTDDKETLTARIYEYVAAM